MRVCVRLTVRLNYPSLAGSLSRTSPAPPSLFLSLSLSFVRVHLCKKQAYDPLVLNIVAPILGAGAFILACAWCAHSHLKHTADNHEQE